jgi:hypothetical protein
MSETAGATAAECTLSKFLSNLDHSTIYRRMIAFVY